MIFLTVGNWHKGFDRLVKAVDSLKAQDIITDEVIAQIGEGSYRPSNLNMTRFFSPAEFKHHLAQSRLTVSHAGIGTIVQAVELAKPLIVLPRRADLGECSNNHQFTTARQLEKQGRILAAYQTSQLPDKLRQAESFIPVQQHNGREILEMVEAFLKMLTTQRTR